MFDDDRNGYYSWFFIQTLVVSFFFFSLSFSHCVAIDFVKRECVAPVHRYDEEEKKAMPLFEILKRKLNKMTYLISSVRLEIKKKKNKRKNEK